MNPYYYDLHIHSCLSPCADDDMTPNNIAGMAAIKGLNVLALTDHNTAKNCPAFFEACKRQGIVPIAGMELSTAEDIHLVCLFSQLEDAMRFDDEIKKHLMPIKNRPEIFGNQLILDGEDNVIGEEETLLISATDLPIDRAIALAKSFGAHVHPAHIDRQSNGIVAILGTVPKNNGFPVFELRDGNRKREFAERYGIDEGRFIVSSDAHVLTDIRDRENYFELDDESESPSQLRKKLFDIIRSSGL